MPKRIVDYSCPFQTLAAVSRLTGLSQDYLRKGVRGGRIPYIRGESSNAPYLINVPLFVQRLDAESRANMMPEACRFDNG